MRKRLVLLVITLCSLAAPAFAFEEPTVAEIQASWAAEPALTQTDIDTYLIIWPQLMDHAREGLVKEDFRPVFRANGWSDIHGSYVLAKMNMALIIIDAPDMLDKLTKSMPRNAMPTPTELELVKQNYAKIMQIQENYIHNAGAMP